MQQQKITIFRKNNMHHAEKKVYNISNTGWICAPFPRNGAHINELALMRAGIDIQPITNLC